MRCHRLVPVLFFALSAVPAGAFELPGTCQVHFSGSSTLHGFSGTGACDPFVLQIQEGTAVLADSVLTVPIAAMQTGNSSRDKKMREMFAADRFPRISGIVDGGPVAEMRQKLNEAARGGKAFPVRLRVRTVEIPVAARVTNLVDTPEALTFDLDFSLSLSACRLEPPSVIGLIKVADEVRVKVGMRVAPLPNTMPHPTVRTGKEPK